MSDHPTDVPADGTPADRVSEVTAALPVAAEATAPAYEWQPVPPKRRKKRAWLWGGIAAGALVVAGAAVASVTLIAPGTTVAGVPVGGLPAGAAADAITSQLASARVDINGHEFTGKQLGLSVDAKKLSSEAFANRPLWNLGAWFGKPVSTSVTVDQAQSNAALKQAFPQAYTAPTDAAVTFTGTTYAATPAKAGSGLDTTTIASSVSASASKGSLGHLTVNAQKVAVDAPLSTSTAQATVTKLNTMLQAVGFYVGTERTVPIAPDVAASWLTITPDAASHTFTIAADQAKIQTAVNALPGEVNRAAQNGEDIVNSAGKVLETVTPTQSARVLGDTATVAKSFADQLAQGKAAYTLPVTETPAQTTKIERSLDVNLENQTVSMIQNGQVVNTWLMSAGLPATPTPTGHFTVWVHVREQTMSSEQYGYSVPNVQWVMYFDDNGDAFHGVYWHNNFGHPMSHGCVGLPVDEAQQLYNWTPNGTEVYIH